MHRVLTIIRELGGIARLSELASHGYSPEIIGMLVDYGRIIRVRKGWYAITDTDDALLRAWRVGGRLACVSALAHHGLGEPDPLALHVSVSRTASRLRTAHDYRERLAEHPDPAIIVHWTRRPVLGDRRAVDAEFAREQAALCRSSGAAHDTL
ncbi:type IV toxin-antitoxin system AbiEi family antitoxin domain-containing protein [Lacisediminihabitans profunda]|uniref:Type IV toxin-antitoxin system AbiEi family antitoxin domain-containing protein n=1 Tax=Lacisediminihabitans profunda TaxID=2594790 RepID=A0A5C8UV81_9MICO|nr:type IV toxin-antitoxin system AbiEi family antitoxin domain-containing protein [Lacisediminihabitans profunda]TXN31526.1 type IV toxin-antitoxin system AbiEi family antitoxin domain-containing protein [Lacisediminihabitans profunda]